MHYYYSSNKQIYFKNKSNIFGNGKEQSKSHLKLVDTVTHIQNGNGKINLSKYV